MNRLLIILTITAFPMYGICQHTENGQILWLTNAAPNIYLEIAKDNVAERWGINLDRVAGCVIYADIAEKIAANHAISEKLLIDKYGNDWEVKFNADIQKEYRLYKKLSRKINRLKPSLAIPESENVIVKLHSKDRRDLIYVSGHFNINMNEDFQFTSDSVLAQYDFSSRKLEVISTSLQNR